MKIKIEIKNRWTGKILFEFEKENNSIKETLLEAIKSGADLSGADLFRANLSRADLSRADLSGADLSGADLSGADLSGANLFRADLSGADLFRADLSGADLSGADLSGANLFRAYLSGADLSGANLFRAYLSGADLSGAKNADHDIAQTRILPEGDLIVYKKVHDGVIKLLIPKEAKRSSAFGRKCRAEFAKVLELPEGKKECFSSFDESFIYKVGKIVKPKEPFDDNWMEECSSGIHFFITRIEAENYQS